ncbi:MAG: porphobilinogen synthase [Acidobacteria bacterium]|nr:porphobilinogen synthase [Acidobacteriota bacterium]MBI3424894.1 porphobilinogen synthase [Acidobacteriota bacterium]
MTERLMRLRAHRHLRDLCAETEFNRAQLIQPLFIVEGLAHDEPITGLRGTARQSIESAVRQVASDLEAGVTQFILFPVPGEKRADGFSHTFAQAAISALKTRFGRDLCLWIDTCLCSSTTTGHCAVLEGEQINLNKTLNALAQAALAFAQAGADGISPSDMMDGRVARIRATLDENGFALTPVMSYSTKFASNFYGPFREAADSAPQFGDRRHYQLDPRMRSAALAASERCAAEGADLLMVKPGLTSLDLIRPIRKRTGKQVGAYQVSGEYAGLSLLAEHGLLNFDAALLETWHVFKRAGAQFIITYGARYAKRLGIAT